MSVTKVVKANARATKTAPASSFVGTVLQDEVVTPTAPSRLRVSRVSFTPGGRTNWHTHPVGQFLYCLSGAGRLQQEGQPVLELMPGDTAFIPAGARHWHGSAPGHLFCHLAMSENNDKGEGTVWLEPVSDTDYNRKPG